MTQHQNLKNSPPNIIPFGNETALDISIKMLRVTGACLMTGDTDTFAALFHLPQELETLTGHRTVKTPEDVKQMCRETHHHLLSEQITKLDRQCLRAEFITPTKIVSTHQTRNWRGTDLVHGPFNSFGMLEKIEGTWLIAFARYAITDNPVQDAILLGLTETTS